MPQRLPRRFVVGAVFSRWPLDEGCGTHARHADRTCVRRQHAQNRARIGGQCLCQCDSKPLRTGGVGSGRKKRRQLYPGIAAGADLVQNTIPLAHCLKPPHRGGGAIPADSGSNLRSIRKRLGGSGDGEDHAKSSGKQLSHALTFSAVSPEIAMDAWRPEDAACDAWPGCLVLSQGTSTSLRPHVFVPACDVERIALELKTITNHKIQVYWIRVQTSWPPPPDAFVKRPEALRQSAENFSDTLKFCPHPALVS